MSRSRAALTREAVLGPRARRWAKRMKVSRSYQTFKYPETYIIGRDGLLRSKVVGERDWIEPAVIRDLVTLLNEPWDES